MRKPVVGHELDPERRQHVKKWRLLVRAFAICFTNRSSIADTTSVRPGLRSREQLPANDLRIRLQQSQSISMAILGDVSQTQIGKGGVEIHIPRKELMRRAHQRIADVVATAG